MLYSEIWPLFNLSLPKDANIFIDAGNVGAQAMHHLEVNGQNICYLSLAMGAMGNSLGVALGATFESKQKSVVIIGDGSFLISGFEIHTAIEHQLPVVIFIFNNHSHGMCSTREKIFFHQESGLNNYGPIDFAQGLRAMFPSLITYDVHSMNQLKEVLNQCYQQKGPVAVSIQVDNSEIPPFLTFQNKGNTNAKPTS